MTWTVATLAERLGDYIGDIDPATKRGAKRRAILDVATKMFAELGYRRASMDEMRARLADPAANRAEREDFPLTDDLSKCEVCVYRRLCGR